VRLGSMLLFGVRMVRVSSCLLFGFSRFVM